METTWSTDIEKGVRVTMVWKIKEKARNKIKPIYLVNTRGITVEEQEAVKDGIETVLKTATVAHIVQINDFGYWNRGPGDFESIDWYIEKAETNKSCGYGQQLDASIIMDLSAKEPSQESEPHYTVFVVDSDLWLRDRQFIIGLSREAEGAVFSAVRFRDVRDERMKYECLKTEALHELGHTFGAAAGRKGVDALTTKYCGELCDEHCANECVMRQGIRVPDAWIKISKDRLTSGEAFCNECIDDLIKYFTRSS